MLPSMYATTRLSVTSPLKNVTMNISAFRTDASSTRYVGIAGVRRSVLNDPAENSHAQSPEEVVGAAVPGAAVLGAAVVGAAVLGAAVLGAAVVRPSVVVGGGGEICFVCHSIIVGDGTGDVFPPARIFPSRARVNFLSSRVMFVSPSPRHSAISRIKRSAIDMQRTEQLMSWTELSVLLVTLN